MFLVTFIIVSQMEKAGFVKLARWRLRISGGQLIGSESPRLCVLEA